MPSIAKVSAKDCGNLESAAQPAPESIKGPPVNVSSVVSEAGSGGRMSPAGGKAVAEPPVVLALNVLEKKIRNLEKRRVRISNIYSFIKVTYCLAVWLTFC